MQKKHKYTITYMQHMRVASCKSSRGPTAIADRPQKSTRMHLRPWDHETMRHAPVKISFQARTVPFKFRQIVYAVTVLKANT
jgi:hypothetical protein